MYAKAAALIGTAVWAYVVLVFQASTTGGVIASAVVLALALVGIGFNVQHDGNHGTFSRHPLVNRLAGFTLDLMGASSYFWKDKHNHNHHVYTNIPHEDADINLGPMARLSVDHQWFWWHRYQHLYLWLLYTCVHLRYLYSDLQRLFLGKNDGLSAGYPKGADMAWLLGGKLFFFTVAFAIPLTRHGIGAVARLYVLRLDDDGPHLQRRVPAGALGGHRRASGARRDATRVGRPPNRHDRQFRHPEPPGDAAASAASITSASIICSRASRTCTTRHWRAWCRTCAPSTACRAARTSP